MVSQRAEGVVSIDRSRGRFALARLASYLRVSAGVVALLANNAAWAQQLPTGGSVAAGTATIAQPNSSTLNINQSTNQAIINWNAFSVGRGGTVNFNQPNSSSATLNRVTGSTPSWIGGTINAPGTVLLVNPNGIAITKSGVVNTGSFTASTLDVNNADFMAGNYRFTGNGGSAAVRNSGRINVSDGGFAALLGGQVANNGVISARLGKVGLGAGELITLDLAGDGFLSVAVPSSQLGKLVDSSGALVSNRGKIRADGGSVFLTAATASNILRDAVNVPGSIRANTVGTHNGRIVIGGGAGGKVSVTGRLAANGNSKRNGGKVEVTGANVALNGKVLADGKNGGNITVASSGDLSVAGKVEAKGNGEQGGRIDLTGANIKVIGALIDASGTTGGGLVRIGGTFQGGNGDPNDSLYQSFIGRFGLLPNIAAAQIVFVDAGSTIDVSAKTAGDAGTTILWSERATGFAGQITGTGGSNGGNGGFAEVSSLGALDVIGNANLSASVGRSGTLLLDPTNVTISTGTQSNEAFAGGTYTPSGTSAVVNITTLLSNLATGNVLITTASAGAGAGTITVANPIGTGSTWTSANSLTLTATTTITISAAITGTNGTLVLNAGATTGNAISVGAAINVGTLTLNSTRPVVQTAAITAANLQLLGAGATYTLTNANNNIGTVAASVGPGSVSLTNGQNLNIGTVGGAIGITATTVNLVLAGGKTASQTQGITATSLTLGGSNATYNLNSAANSITNLAGGTVAAPLAAVTFVNSKSLTIGTVGSFTGLNSTGAINVAVNGTSSGLSVTRSITGADAIILATTGSAGDITLSGTNTTVSTTYAGSAGAITLTAGRDITVNATLTANNATGTTGNVIGLTAVRNVTLNGVANISGATGSALAIIAGKNITLGGYISADNGLLTLQAGNNSNPNAIITETSSASGFFVDRLLLTTAATTLTNGPVVTLGYDANSSSGSSVRSTIAANVASFDFYGFQGYQTITNIGTIGSVSGITASGDVKLWTANGGLSSTAAISTQGTLSIFTGSFAQGASVAANTYEILGGNVTANAAAAVSVSNFNLYTSWTQVGTLAAFSASNFSIQGSQFVRATGGDGSSANPYVLTDAYGLQGVGNMLSSGFKLGSNIDASGTANWNGGAGFVPIGTVANPCGGCFSGTFNGNGFAISGLTINLPNAVSVGLFAGSSGSISNVTLSDTNVSGFQTVGALVGSNFGTISNSSVTGTNFVTGVGSGNNVGGLVGYNNAGASITGSSSNAIVSNGGSYAGGLVGQNFGAITNSHSTGNVSGYSYVGGLIGNNRAAVSNVYATGTVTGGVGSSAQYIGGLIGSNSSSVTQAYATGNVYGDADSSHNNFYFGGLIGYSSGSTSQSFATGTVSGNRAVGGLVGYQRGGSITNSYARGGSVSGSSEVGGLVGDAENSASITGVYAANTVSASLGLVGALVGTAGSGVTITSGYWDSTIAGAQAGIGQNSSGNSLDAQGLSTSSLKAALPSGFSTSFWGIVPGSSYPYLMFQPGVVSGTVYSTYGGAALGAGVSVAELVNGSGSLTVVTDANGKYSFFLDGLSGGSGDLLVYTSAGASYQQSVSSAIVLNIYGGYLLQSSAGSSASSLATALTAAAAGNTAAQTLVTSLSGSSGNRVYNLTGLSFVFDQAVSTGNLVLSTTGAVTQTAPIVATNLLLTGNGSYTLTNTGNQVGTLAANTGSLSLTDSIALTVNTVLGTNGIAASGDVTLTADLITLTAATGAINAIGNVTVAPYTAGTLISVGSGSSGFVVDSAMMALINADTLTIGNASAGALTVNQSIAPNANNLALVSGSTITQTTGTITVGGLGLQGTTATMLGATTATRFASATTSGPTINFTGDLTIAAIGPIDGISWTDSTTATIKATGNINVAASIRNSGGGSLVLYADSAAGGVGAVTFTNGARIQFANNSGNVTIYEHRADYPTFSDFTSNVAMGSGVYAQYNLVDSAADLQAINNNLTPSTNGLTFGYALNRDLDMSGFGNFTPLSNGSTYFALVFDGQYHTISNLTINDLTSTNVGLFGLNYGTIRNVALTNVNVTAGASATSVGSVAGYNYGTIQQVYVTGAVQTTGGGARVGGLVGENDGQTGLGVIQQVYANVYVSADTNNVTGGLIGSYRNGGTVSQAYATGYVTTTGATIGGVFGGSDFCSGCAPTTTAVYWDTQTSGQASGTGDTIGMPTTTGRTTAQLQGSLPAGFDPAVWGTGSGLYPYLKGFFPTPPQAVSGNAYSDRAGTVAAGVAVSGLANGTSLGSSYTGANGYYYLLAPAGTFTANSQVVTYTTGATAGASFQQNAGTLVSGLNIYGTYLTESTAATTLSAANAGLSTAIGGNSVAQAVVNGLTNREYDLSASIFDIDQSISTGTLVLSSTGTTAVTQSAGAITASGLDLLGTGAGSYTLTRSGNQIASLAANMSTGAITLADSTALSIGTVAGTAGITAATLSLAASSGNISQTAVITTTGTASFTTTANTAAITLTNTSNSIAGAISLTTGSNGAASVTNNRATVLGASTVGGNLAVIARTNTGTITQTGGLTVAGTSAFTTQGTGTGAGITLTSAGNLFTGAVSFTTAGTNAASLTNGRATVLGASTVLGALTVIGSAGNITQTGALSITGLASFTASASGATINLSTTTNSFAGAVSLNTNGAGSDATLVNNRATLLGASTVGGNFAVTDRTTGSITQNGALTVTGMSSFSTTANNATITLTNGSNAFTGAVSLSTTGTTADASLTNGIATVLGTSSIGRNLVVMGSTGNMSQTGAVTAGGTASFTTSAANATIALTATNQITGAISLATNGASANATLTNGRATVLGTSNIGGALTILGTAGAISQSGATVLTVGGASSFTASANNAAITLTNNNALTDAVSLNTNGTTGNASLTNTKATALAASTVAGNLTVIDKTAGNISQTGALIVSGTSAFTNQVTGGTITLDQNNQLAGAISLSTTGAGGNATLVNTLATTLPVQTVSGALNVTSGGNLSITGVVTAASATLLATGNLTIAASSRVAVAANNNAVLSATANFINNGGSTAISVSGNGRWLVYSNTPGSDTFGGLNSASTAVWNATYATVAPGSVAAGNRYLFAFQPTLTFTTTGATVTYGDGVSVAGNYTVSGLQPAVANAYLADTASTTYSGTPTVTSTGSGTGANVGTYSVDIVQGAMTALNGYAFSFAGNGQLTVTARAVTVTADAQAKTYGDANPALTYQVTTGNLVNGDSLSGALSTTATAASGVGAYAITQGGVTNANNANYNITYAGANLSIGQRAVTVTADAQAKTYGDANPALTYQVTTGNLVNGDSLSGALSTTATAGSGVGAYAITQGGVTNANNANYNITYAGANLSIGQRAVTVTADAQSKTYGDANPALTYQVTTGNLVNGDSLSGALSTVATAASGVGGYGIAQNTLTSTNNPNYNISYVAGALNVTARAVTVTADTKSKIYGDANPALTYQVTSGNLVNGDSLSGALTTAATAVSNVGSYAITPNTVTSANNPNYNVTYVGANLTVGQRAVTVTADAQAKTYGAANPALTYTTSSLGQGAALAGSLTTVAASSDVGVYGINQGSVTNANNLNYLINYVGAGLTINRAQLTVIADDKARVVNGPNPQLTATYVGLVNGDDANAVSGLTLATLADVNSSAGRYSIDPLRGNARNYTINYVSGTMLVTSTGTTTVPNSQTNPTSPSFPANILTIPSVNPPTGVTQVSFTPPVPVRVSNTPSTDIAPAALPSGQNLATNNGLTYGSISQFDPNQYSQFKTSDWALQAGEAAIFVMIARGADQQHAADAFIDGFWNGTSAAWTPPQSFAAKVTFSDGGGNTVNPTGNAGFPISAVTTDFGQLLKNGPVMISDGATPAHWLLATQVTSDGKGIVANDPASGKQVVLNYDAATKTVGSVTSVFDANSNKFVSFAEASAGTPALAGLQGFVPSNFIAVSAR